MRKKIEQRAKRLHQALIENPDGISREDLILILFGEKRAKGISTQAFAQKKRSEFFKTLQLLKNWDNKTVEIISESVRDINKKRTYTYYKYKKGSVLPDFSEKKNSFEFDDEQKATLPFLLGILEAFQSIPIIDKFLLDMEDQFGIKPDDYQKFTLITRGFRDFNKEEELKLILSINKCINLKKVISFYYNHVRSVKEEKIHTTVLPLAILLYDGMYYLWAVTPDNDKVIERYRIDRIDNLSTIEESIQFQFNFGNIQKRVNQVLEYTIGVVPPKPQDTVKKFKIRFFDWAASYVLGAKIHETMKVISIDKTQNSCTVEFMAYDTFEVSFLLGRFRNYFKIIEPKNYQLDMRKEKS